MVYSENPIICLSVKYLLRYKTPVSVLPQALVRINDWKEGRMMWHTNIQLINTEEYECVLGSVYREELRCLKSQTIHLIKLGFTWSFTDTPYVNVGKVFPSARLPSIIYIIYVTLCVCVYI